MTADQFSVPAIRAKIKDRLKDLALAQKGDPYRDSRMPGTDLKAVSEIVSDLESLRQEFLDSASWADLETDEERDQYLISFLSRRAKGAAATDGIKYLARRLADARMLQTCQASQTQLSHQVRGLKDQVDVLRHQLNSAGMVPAI